MFTSHFGLKNLENGSYLVFVVYSLSHMSSEPHMIATAKIEHPCCIVIIDKSLIIANMEQYMNGYRIHVDIMTGRRGKLLKGIVILASYKFHFIRIHNKIQVIVNPSICRYDNMRQ